MFENMRIGSLYPPSSLNNNQSDPMAEFEAYIAPQLRLKQAQEDYVNNAVLQHSSQGQPINRYSQPLTTNNELPHGLTPPNSQIATHFVDKGQINPLDMAKLRQGEEKIDVSRQKESTDSGIKQQRADIYDYKSKHPDHKFDLSGPTVKVMNPADGSIYDTGMDTGKLSMEDKMKLSSNLGVMRDTNRSNMSQSNALGQIAARGEQTRQTQKEKPTKSTTQSNTQVNQGYLNKANELVNSDPKYKDYISIKTNQDGKPVGFTVNPPKEGMGSDDPTYHEVNSKIYGSGGSDVTIPSEEKPDPLGIR